MSRSSFYRLPLLGIACLSLPLLLVAGQELTFRFSPPDGHRELQQLRSVISIYVNDKLFQRDVQELTAGVRYRKKGDGWRMESKLKAYDLSRNGEAIQAPTLESMLGKKLVYHITAEGQLTTIDGYDKIVRAMLSSFPRAARKEMAKQIRVEDLVAREQVDWLSRYSRFIGKPATIDDEWADQVMVSTGDGSAEVHRRTLFHELSADGTLEVRLAWHTDGDILKRLMPIIRAQYDAIPLVTPPDLEIAVFGKGKRFFTPASMMLQRESFTRIIAATGRDPDNRPIPVVRIEEKTYTFTPDP